MYGSGLTLLWPGLESDTARYTASLSGSVTHDADWEYCPLCGNKIRFGQQTVDGPNGYTLHDNCHTIALHDAVEADADLADPVGEWLSDSISEAIIARGEQYDDYKYAH